MPKNPNNHVKPTKEELEAQTKAAIEEAEKLKETPDEEDPDVEAAAKAEAEGEEEKEEETEEILDEEEEKEEEKEEEQAEPSKGKEELKEEVKKKDEKLSASAREAQKLYAKNRVINKALSDAEDVPEPTEEEMKATYGDDWDMFSDREKEEKKEIVIGRNWRKVISEAKQQATKIEKWNESVEEFVDDPKTLNDNPDLEGKTDEFKAFATQDSNNSVPMNILVSAFLHENSQNKQPNKGRMFEKGSGGSNEKPKLKNGVLTLEEGRKLRVSNYELWKQKLAQGKIQSDL